MMYLFMQLDDHTEIVHSKMLERGVVKIYIEQPIFQGFNSATFYLPTYEWEGIEGFSDNQIAKLEHLIKSASDVLIELAREATINP